MKEFRNIDWDSFDLNNIEDGAYYDMPINTYHSCLTHYSSTLIKHGLKDMAHFRYEEIKLIEKVKSGVVEKKIEFDFGNAYESALCEKDKLKELVAVLDKSKMPFPKSNMNKKENREWYSEFLEENKDKYIINATGDHSIESITEMVNTFYEHPDARESLQTSMSQISIFWTCPYTGIKLRTRPDLLSIGLSKIKVRDIKTSKDNTLSAVLKQVCNMDYPFQAALQVKGLMDIGILDDFDKIEYAWLVTGKKAPYNTHSIVLPQEDLSNCIMGLNNLLTDISKSKELNEYLPYNPRVNNGKEEHRLPSWYKMGNNIETLSETYKD